MLPGTFAFGREQPFLVDTGASISLPESTTCRQVHTYRNAEQGRGREPKLSCAPMDLCLGIGARFGAFSVLQRTYR